VKLHQQQRRLDALAADHQEREEEDSGQRRDARLPRRGLEVSFDFAFNLAAGTPHVDRQREHRHGGDERERPFEPFLIGRIEQQVPAGAAHGDSDGDAPVDGLGQLAPAALSEIREADGDNQKRFESFAESDDERLQHGARDASAKVRLSLRIYR
jgi:hypothetical protein